MSTALDLIALASVATLFGAMAMAIRARMIHAPHDGVEVLSTQLLQTALDAAAAAPRRAARRRRATPERGRQPRKDHGRNQPDVSFCRRA